MRRFVRWRWHVDGLSCATQCTKMRVSMILACRDDLICTCLRVHQGTMRVTRRCIRLRSWWVEQPQQQGQALRA